MLSQPRPQGETDASKSRYQKCLAVWYFLLTTSMSGFSHSQVLEGSRLEITDEFPELVLIDTDTVSTSWEIEARHPYPEISRNGSFNGSGPFKIFGTAAPDALTLTDNGSVTVLSEGASDSESSLEVFKKGNSADITGITVTDDTTNPNSARFQIDFGGFEDHAAIATRFNGNSFTTPFKIDLMAPDDSLEIDLVGDINLGVRDDFPGSLTISRPGTASIIMESGKTSTSTPGIAQWEIKTNAGTGRMTFNNLLAAQGAPFKFAPDAVNN